jgi:hypothetical protein
MLKKNLSIDFEHDYDFLLIGICSPLKSYTTGYHLNKNIFTNLIRSKKDLSMEFPDGIEVANFPLFEYWDNQFQNQWYLLANKCTILCCDRNINQGTIFDKLNQSRKKTKYLIPENPKIDFYIQIHGIYNEESKINLLKNIKRIDRIVSVHEINIENIRSKENLIIDE